MSSRIRQERPSTSSMPAVNNAPPTLLARSAVRPDLAAAATPTQRMSLIRPVEVATEQDPPGISDFVGQMGTATLREGMGGDSVHHLQNALRASGFNVEADGDFGPKTEAAIRRFQQIHGLEDDGIVGPMTRGAFGSSLTDMMGSGTLRRGASGASVKAMQQALVEGGIPMAVDGEFGPATQAAVRQFQLERGLAVDGIVGPATRAAMASIIQPQLREEGTTTAPPTTAPPTTAPPTTAPPTTAPPTQGAPSNALRDANIQAVIAAAPQSAGAYPDSAMPAILNAAASLGVTNPNQLAYILATAEHETNFGKPRYSRSESMVEDSNPFRGGGNSWSARVHTNGRTVTGSSRDQLEINYWDSAYGGRLGNRRGTSDARDFRGRGLVQLTGRSNYANMTQELNSNGFSYTVDGVTYGGPQGEPIDLISNPDHVNRNTDLAAGILVVGSMQGEFTGRGIPDYINDSQTDFVNARRVINGDTAKNGQSIANTAQRYADVLRRNGWGPGV